MRLHLPLFVMFTAVVLAIGGAPLFVSRAAPVRMHHTRESVARLIDGGAFVGASRAHVMEVMGTPDYTDQDDDLLVYSIGSGYSLLFGPQRYFLEVYLEGDSVKSVFIADR